MDTLDILTNEYNNLWHEKLLHKQSIRKFHYYITYITSVSSFVETFIGLSLTGLIKGIENPSYNPVHIAIMLMIPLTPIVLLLVSFAINDLFQIYVIGTQIGNIEKKFNNILGINTLLTWEHRICPVVYGGSIDIKLGYCGSNLEPISNVIRLSDYLILLPFVLTVCGIASFLGANFLYANNYIISFAIYIGIIVYLIFIELFVIGWKLLKYTKPNSSLARNLDILNRRF